MDKFDQLSRTKAFSLRVIRLVDSMPRKVSAQVIARQLMRCSTSMSINYRAACRAKSPADFLSKMKLCEEESDETVGWLELIADSGMVAVGLLQDLMNEARQLNAIITAACKTTAENLSKMRPSQRRKPRAIASDKK